ncbi:MAG TPA: RtcB family protein [Balneolales bacterium]|nr:RtcB family protein [Balneolales bacterium]
MVIKEQLIKKSDFLWEIPKTFRDDMLVPAHIYALEEMLDDLFGDRSLEQLINVTTLRGIQKAAVVMPDAHEGYGFPIGGIAATEWPHGVISPGGIGYDINCGVRLLVTDLMFDDVSDRLEKLSEELYAQIPSGVGRGGSIKLSLKEIDMVLKEGAAWAVRNGYGLEEDIDHIESNGVLNNADPRSVSEHAKKRGNDQLGTIGAGNHFVEVDKVDNIFNDSTASVLNLHKNQIVVLIHTGSRGFGHQVATDYLRIFLSAMDGYDLHPPDRELACAPFNSPEGQKYFDAMACAANFAWCNREVITWEVRKALTNVFGKSTGPIRLLYDVAHNIAKIEEHKVDHKIMKLIVHRKGATRAFGPGRKEIPADYRETGQPVLIPGSMGTASYVLTGTSKSMEATFGSSCHGAGRRMSRKAAKREVDAPQLQQKLRGEGIYVQAGSYAGIAEEAPIAYKDVDIVVETVHKAGIAEKIAKLKPLAVIKG